MSDLRSQILAAEDRSYEDVEVDEWGGAEVRVRGLSGHGAEQFARQFQDDGEVPRGVMVDLLVRTLEDPESGEPIFEDNEEDKEALGRKSSRVIARLFNIAQRVSGLTDIDEAKND